MCAEGTFGDGSDDPKHRKREGSTKKKRQPKKLPPVEERPYFTFEETVKVTGIGESTLYKRARNWKNEPHKCPKPYKNGNRWLFKKTDVWKWMDEGGTEAA